MLVQFQSEIRMKALKKRQYIVEGLEAAEL